MTEMFRVRVHAGAVAKTIFRCQLSALTLVSVSGSTPMLPQQHVEDTDHSAKSAGGRLQHPTYVGFE